MGRASASPRRPALASDSRGEDVFRYLRTVGSLARDEAPFSFVGRVRHRRWPSWRGRSTSRFGIAASCGAPVSGGCIVPRGAAEALLTAVEASRRKTGSPVPSFVRSDKGAARPLAHGPLKRGFFLALVRLSSAPCDGSGLALPSFRWLNKFGGSRSRPLAIGLLSVLIDPFLPQPAGRPTRPPRSPFARSPFERGTAIKGREGENALPSRALFSPIKPGRPPRRRCGLEPTPLASVPFINDLCETRRRMRPLPLLRRRLLSLSAAVSSFPSSRQRPPTPTPPPRPQTDSTGQPRRARSPRPSTACLFRRPPCRCRLRPLGRRPSRRKGRHRGRAGGATTQKVRRAPPTRQQAAALSVGPRPARLSARRLQSRRRASPFLPLRRDGPSPQPAAAVGARPTARSRLRSAASTTARSRLTPAARPSSCRSPHHPARRARP